VRVRVRVRVHAGAGWGAVDVIPAALIFSLLAAAPRVRDR
jgi:hypothetical protein